MIWRDIGVKFWVVDVQGLLSGDGSLISFVLELVKTSFRMVSISNLHVYWVYICIIFGVKKSVELVLSLPVNYTYMSKSNNRNSNQNHGTCASSPNAFHELCGYCVYSYIVLCGFTKRLNSYHSHRMLPDDIIQNLLIFYFYRQSPKNAPYFMTIIICTSEGQNYCKVSNILTYLLFVFNYKVTTL